MDAFFLLDIIITFNTAYYNDYLKIVDDRSEIAKNYFQRWFFIDLISIIPFELVADFGSGNLNGLVRFAKIGKLYKLIKIARLLKLLKLLTEQSRIF